MYVFDSSSLHRRVGLDGDDDDANEDELEEGPRKKISKIDFQN
jgi:hypothetical protein